VPPQRREGIGDDVFHTNGWPFTLVGGETANTLSDDRLLGIIFNNDVTGFALTHEVMHQWALPEDRLLQFLEGTDHYGDTTDIVGIMRPVVNSVRRNDTLIPGDFVSNGDGTFRVQIRVGLNASTFSPISLCLAGFIPASQVPPIASFTEPINLSDPDRVTVGGTVVDTIADFVAAFGSRTPTSANSPRDFTLGTLVVADRPFTSAEYTWITLVLRYFESSESYDGLRPASMGEATLGASTLTTALPTQGPEPKPAPEPGTTTTLSVRPGFNLLDWMDATPIDQATETLAADFDTIFAFDPQTKLFISFSPTAPAFLNSLDEVTAGKGPWALSNSAGSWEQPLSEAPLSIPLRSWFNLVVWTGEDGIAVEEAVEALGSMLASLFTWDATAQSFRSFSSAAPSFLNDADVLRAEHGVWVDVSQNVTWDQGG
jgi:hypothetical protein